jgi:hypothetical protein
MARISNVDPVYSNPVVAAPPRTLTGKLIAESKAGVSLVQVPPHAAGTTQEPVNYPTVGALQREALLGTTMLTGAGNVGGSEDG